MRTAQKLTALVVILAALGVDTPSAAQTSTLLARHSGKESSISVVIQPADTTARVRLTSGTREPGGYWYVDTVTMESRGPDSGITMELCTGHTDYDPSGCRAATMSYSGTSIIGTFDPPFRMEPNSAYEVVIKRPGSGNWVYMVPTTASTNGLPGWDLSTEIYGRSGSVGRWRRLYSNRGIYTRLDGRAVTPLPAAQVASGPIQVLTPEHWNTETTDQNPTVFGAGDEIRFEYIFSSAVTADSNAYLNILLNQAYQRRARVDPAASSGSKLIFKYKVDADDPAGASVGVLGYGLEGSVGRIHTVDGLDPSAADLAFDRVDSFPFTLDSSRRGAAPDQLAVDTHSPYSYRDRIELAVSMTDDVIVPSGVIPEMKFGMGESDVWATYDPVSSMPSRLVFTYQVAAGDRASDGIKIYPNLDGSIIKSSDLIAADFLWTSTLADQVGRHAVDGSVGAPTPPREVTNLAAEYQSGGVFIASGVDVSWTGLDSSTLHALVPIVGYEYRYGKTPVLTGAWILSPLSPNCTSTTMGQCAGGSVELRNLDIEEYWFEVRAKGIHSISGLVYDGVASKIRLAPSRAREPSPVRFLRYSLSNDGGVDVREVTLQWTPPAASGIGEFVQYEWELVESNAPSVTIADDSTATTAAAFNAADLTAGRDYIFKVRVCAEEVGGGRCRNTNSSALRSAFTSLEFTASAPDSTPPIARSAVVREDELTILFAEKLSEGSLNAGNFTVTKNTPAQAVTVSAATAVGYRVILTLDSPVIRGDTVRLGYDHSSRTGSILDQAGNAPSLTSFPASHPPPGPGTSSTWFPVVNATGHRSTNPPTDVEPPRPIESGGADGSRAVLVFSEDLDTRSRPPVYLFTVSSTSHNVIRVQSVQICGARVQLNLTRDLAGHSVRVDYTEPSASAPQNRLQDRATPVPNPAATFYGQHLLDTPGVVGCDSSSPPSSGPMLETPFMEVTAIGQDALHVGLEDVAYSTRYRVQWHGPGASFSASDGECGAGSGRCESSEGRDVTISGLEFDTRYQIRGRAENDDIVSAWVEGSAATRRQLTVPSLTLDSVTASSASFSIGHIGSADDFAVQTYEIQWKEYNTLDYPPENTMSQSAATPPLETSVLIAGLAEFTDYQARARAVGVEESSAWSDGVSFETPSLTGTLGIVESVDIDLQGESAVVSFSRVPNATGYRVQWKLSAGEYSASVSQPTKTSPYSITYLSPGRYRVQVRGERGNIHGPWKESAEFRILSWASPDFTIRRGTADVTHTTAFATFPATEHDAIDADGYELRAEERQGEKLVTAHTAFASQADDSWAATLTGLKSSTSYVAFSRAVRGGVYGEWGEAAAFYTNSAPGCDPNTFPGVQIPEGSLRVSNAVKELARSAAIRRFWVTSKNVEIAFSGASGATGYAVGLERIRPSARSCNKENNHCILYRGSSTSISLDLDRFLSLDEALHTGTAHYQVSVNPTCGSGSDVREGTWSQPVEMIFSATDPDADRAARGPVRPNTAPTAADDSASVPEDMPLLIPVLDNDEDADEDVLEVTRVLQPEHGTTRIVDGEVEYRPTTNFNGSDRFAYTMSDGLATADAEVAVVVEAVNDPPEPVGLVPDQTVEVATPVTVGLAELFRDPDGDELRYTAVVAGSAMVSVTGSQLLIEVVEPGASVVTVTAADPEGLTAEQVIAVQGTDNRPRDVVEDTLAAIGRGYLASARATLSRRVESNGQEQSRVTVAGVSVPMTGTEAASSAQQWLTSMAGPSMRTESAGMMRQQPADTGSREDGIRSPFLGSGPTEFMVGFGGTGEEEGSGRRWTAWGQSDMQMFDGGRNSATYGGSLLSTYVGVDAKLSERWLAGLAVSRSRAEADWSFGGADGLLTTSMTSLQPYVRWADDSTSVWAMAGGGSGNIGNDRLRYGLQEQKGLGLRLGLAEARRQLGTVGGGMHLALRGDASWAHLSTDEGVQLIDGIGVGVHQLRMGVDVSSSFIAGGAEFEPFGEVHARRDGGSGQTGSGMELAGGLRVSRGIFRVEGMGRVLTMHTAENYRERGAALMLSVGEGAQQPGLTLSLQPRWGAPASGSQMLWQDQLYGSMQDGNEQSLDARIDYGVEAWGGLVSPFSLYGSSQYGQRMQLGMSVGVGPLQLESSVERNADPLRGGTATRVSIMGSLSLNGR